MLYELHPKRSTSAYLPITISQSFAYPQPPICLHREMLQTTYKAIQWLCDENKCTAVWNQGDQKDQYLYVKNNQSAVNFDDQVFNLFNHRAPSTTKKCLQTPIIMEFHL